MAPHFHNFETGRIRILTGTAKIRQQNRRKQRCCAVINKKISVHFCTDILRGKQEFSCTVILLHCRYPCWQNLFLSAPLCTCISQRQYRRTYTLTMAPLANFLYAIVSVFSRCGAIVSPPFSYFPIFFTLSLRTSSAGKHLGGGASSSLMSARMTRQTSFAIISTG